MTLVRALATLVVLPALLFLAIALFWSKKAAPTFSTAHKNEIASIAERICRAGEVHPCPVSWRGKNKWFGVLERSGTLAVASPAQVRATLNPPEWSERIKDGHYVFSNGGYTVSVHAASGTISITSTDHEQSSPQ